MPEGMQVEFHTPPGWWSARHRKLQNRHAAVQASRPHEKISSGEVR